ncbi:MAG: apolipoprotein N-acyltransferase [Candidatus Rokuibacteriota bacterium]|nr:MAG: apolipoprotein N-acyltransferase [Candidatus Rokubacteria bacterium]
MDAGCGGGRSRARPPVPRERGERRPAPGPRRARGVRALGRRAWRHRHSEGAVRRRRCPAQDHRRRPTAVPRRPPRVGRLIGASALRENLALAALLSVSAIGLALAFPRTDWDGVVWLLVAPVIVTALSRAPRAALGWGWLFGTVFFLVLLRWLGYTFGVYSAIPWPLTWVPILALAAYCGLYVGGFAWAVSWIGRRRAPGLALAAAPFLWVAGEWVRSHLLGGFPWGTLGYSQYLRLPIIQIAELGGVHAVSFVLVAVNAAAAGCLVLPWRGALTGALACGALLAATLGFGTARLATPPRPGEVTVAIMQPAIEQPLKFDPTYVATTLGIYSSLTRRASAEHPQLVVWPETAVATPLRRDPGLVDGLIDLARTLRVALLVGSIDVNDTTPPKLTNSAFLLTEHGVVERYDKIHLVPFGEFVPFSSLLGFIRGWAEFISELEPGSNAVVFQGPPAPFGVVICYEGIFPELVREFVRGGARLIVNMTNDAWFGRTDGPWQHLAMYPLRAVEHRTAVVRAANTGVSAFIAPTGQILRRLSLSRRAIMVERLPLRSGETLYSKFGEWLAYLALGVTAGTLAASARGWRR